ncbi:hypothetical protein LTS18_008461, partial [Coniosporium uncinatum]
MSPAIAAAESQWLEQLAEMRRAIADLNIPKSADTSQTYGHDLHLDDEDLSENSSDDIWNLISGDEEDVYSSDQLDMSDGIAANDSSSSTSYDDAWLKKKCQVVSQRTSGLDADNLQDQIMAVLGSDSQDDELQMLLADILGYEELDLVAELISHRKGITAAVSAALQQSANGVTGRLLTRKEREDALRRQDYEHKHKSLAPSVNRESTQYPHVYKAHDAGNTLSSHGQKYALPLGSERKDHEKYEEYSIPAAKTGVLGLGQKLVEIKEMDGLCQRTFKGYKSLNRMQSLVHPVAYQTSENMLICAPTGAGKTDAAMLAILNVISKNITPNPSEHPDAIDFTLHAEDFKIVYVAPMKALAAEVTEKLGKRLAWLGVRARELTGDMHLTKAEILDTQIIVTTPEKWDVVTRKSTGDTELVQKVRLLIIDEVHMLHDERGAVLESLVARTERQVESTQSLIRIVGLSATLPNYIDVADFLKVNRMAGLFYFDASFRPVPLEQHFIGVKGKAGTKNSRDNLDAVAFEKVKDMLSLGHQVMVF